MDAKQALQILMQALVTKPGLSLQECGAVVQAWNVIALAVGKTEAAPVGEETKEAKE